MLIHSHSRRRAMPPAPADEFAARLAWGQQPRTFVFGPFQLHPERQLLLKLGTPVRIGGRALDLLTLLVERAGELVSKQELVSRAWPDTYVDEGNLKVNIAGLRRVLDECPAVPHFIATVVGRGYRFIGSVDALVTPLEGQGSMPPVGSHGQPWQWINRAPSRAECERRSGDRREINDR